MWTIDYIFISRVGEEVVIDSIPLYEADTITSSEALNESDEKAMVKGDAGGSRKIYPEDANEVKNKKLKCLQENKIDGMKPAHTKGKIVLKITTIPEGFNSGTK